jgi:lipopolysaccharide transport system permease protein
MSQKQTLISENKVYTVVTERVIRANQGWLRMDWKRVLHYQDLLLLLVQRDLAARYRQTLLGPAWFIFQPLLTTAIFAALFGHALRIPTDGVPAFLFYQCGMLLWSYFSTTLTAAGNTFGANAGIFTKVYFPRIVTPLAHAMANLATLAVQAATFLACCVLMRSGLSGLHPNWAAVAFLPIVVAWTAILALGVGFISSALSAKYRDMQILIPFLVQTWMFVTPVVYPLSQLGPRARLIALLNPMASLVEISRLAVFGRGTIEPNFVVLSAVTTGAAFVVGLAFFNRAERSFADTI